MALKLLCWAFVSVYILCTESVVSETPKVGQPLLCDGCVAMFQELHKMLRVSSGRKRVVSSTVDRLCNVNNFVVYRHSPPKMLKACNYIKETHRTKLEESLVTFYKKYKTDHNKLLQEEFCVKGIQACYQLPKEGVEMRPMGMSLDEANEQLKSIQDAGEDVEATLEKPPQHTTPIPKEEL